MSYPPEAVTRNRPRAKFVPAGPERTRSRGYQMEMFEQSMKRNIIVTILFWVKYYLQIASTLQNQDLTDTRNYMELYSAVLRIRAHLEKGDGKLCWFLVPSVPLGNQQYDVLRSSLPPVNVQFLSGSDNVDKWSGQDIWDGVLKLKEKAPTVVVSTHQILLDALTHGFVTIDKIGLLIFDEAHHCVGKHPANRIMEDFYHPYFHRVEVPAILGLTASPVIKAKPTQLKIIETNLNSISRSPILNREELMQHVHHPVLSSVTYSAGLLIHDVLSPRFSLDMETSAAEKKNQRMAGKFPADDSDGYLSIQPAKHKWEALENQNSFNSSSTSDSVYWSMPAFKSFLQAFSQMDIEQDPHVRQLRSTDPPDEKRIRETVENKSTRSHRQMRGIKSKAQHILGEYGVWATEWYIKVVVQRTLEAADENAEKCMLTGWDQSETLYLRDTLKKIYLPEDLGAIEGGVTEKVEKLIGILLKEYYGNEGGREFAGLVFVEQRVGVSVLAEIVRSHPRSKDIFNVGTLVGAADNDAKSGRNIYELTSLVNQNTVIDGFRQRTKNLVISTSVVEEGLDIPSCHLVVCFSLPPNLKSFIQRRGRARRVKSSYFLMFEKGSDTVGKIDKLRQLEREMVAEYLDETRKLKEILDREEDEADEDGIISDGDNRKFFIESTGALLTLDSAIPHLQHFCGTLPHTPYTDLNPIFTIESALPGDKGFYESEKSLYRAEVLLPNSIPAKARRATSKKTWEKKRWAKSDAAFEAYLALHKLGDPLINDNLLPLLINDSTSAPVRRTPTIPSPKTMDPWAAMHWKEGTAIYATPIILMMPNSRGPVEIEILTPIGLPHIDKIPIYWTKSETGEVSVGESRCLGVNQEFLLKAKKMTYELLHTIFGTKMKSDTIEFPYLFAWKNESGWWDLEDGRTINALEAYTAPHPDGDDFGIVRENNQGQKPLIFRRWRTDLSPSNDEKIAETYRARQVNPDQPIIEVVSLSTRRDFLHEAVAEVTPEATFLLLPQYCTIDKIPWSYSQFALFLPGVIHRIEIALVAWDLQRTLLASVDIKSTSNIIAALTATSARESTNYLRSEFIGDSLLKFLTSVNLLEEHPSWHEGNLTTLKTRMVSNFCLSRAAQRNGLSKWVITEPFTGLKWSPRYIIPAEGEPEPEPSTPNKTISTRVLADVLEALIGAAYIDGGYEKAVKCIFVLGLERVWKPFQARIDSLVARAIDSPAVKIPYLRDLENLIGYNFKHQALLIESITHPSCESPFPSYQRLEFLGDAVLDMIVLDELLHHPKKLSSTDMHHLKSAVVNGNLLAFLSLSFSMDIEKPKVQQLGRNIIEFQVVSEKRKVNLWEFVHLSHPEMIEARKKCVRQYEEGLRDRTQVALDTSMYYPWAELSPLDAGTHGQNKLLADIIEAIIGAIFVDSGGNFDSVKDFVERLGVLKVLRRFVNDGVNLLHPSNRLAEAVASMHKEPVLCIENIEGGEYVHSIWFEGEELATIRSSSRVVSKVVAAELGLKKLEEIIGWQEEPVKGDTGISTDVEMDLS